MEASRDILHGAWQCLKLFKECQSSQTELTVLQSHQQRYWAWANSLKVFAEAHINLDAQLKDDSFDGLRQPIILLLGVLRDNLELALHIIKHERDTRETGNQNNPSVDKRVSNVPPGLEVPTAGIEGSLTRLERIAIIILRATQFSLARRIQAYAGRTRDDDFENLFDSVLLYRFPKCPQALRDILRESVVFRYTRIRYERSHRAPEASTLARVERPVAQPPQIRAQNPRPLSAVTVDKLAQIPELSKDSQSKATTTPLTLDQEIVRQELKQGLSIPASRGMVDTVSQSETGDAVYPSPPAIAEGNVTATCQICLQDFPVNLFQGLKWRAHVDHDLQPYVCISEACASSLRFFANRSSWTAHMRKTHTALWIRTLHNDRLWTCSMPHEESQMFDSQKDLLDKHMKVEHDDYDEPLLQAMANDGSVPQRRPIDVCPICGDEHRPQQRLKDHRAAEAYDSATGDEAAEDETPNREDQHRSRPGVRFTVADTKFATNSQQKTAKQTPQNVEHARMERYIAKHLKALAFYFARPLISPEHDEGESTAPRSRSEDGVSSLEPADFDDGPTPVPGATLTDVSNLPFEVHSLHWYANDYEKGLKLKPSDLRSWAEWWGGPARFHYELSGLDAGAQDIPFTNWLASAQGLHAFQDYLTAEPPWTASAPGYSAAHESEWVQEVCARSREAVLHDSVEVWCGLEIESVYLVMADILIITQACLSLPVDGDSDIFSLENVEDLFHLLQKRVGTLHVAGNSTPSYSKPSAFIKTLRASYTKLEHVWSSQRFEFQLMRSKASTDKFAAYDKVRDRPKAARRQSLDIIPALQAIKDTVLFNLGLAQRSTRDESIPHSISHDQSHFSDLEDLVMKELLAPFTDTKILSQTLDTVARKLWLMGQSQVDVRGEVPADGLESIQSQSRESGPLSPDRNTATPQEGAIDRSQSSEGRSSLFATLSLQTERLRQRISPGEIHQDAEYDKAHIEWQNNRVHLLIVSKDFEGYLEACNRHFAQWQHISAAIANFAEGESTDHLLTGRLRLLELRACADGIMTIALPDHSEQVNRVVVEPMRQAMAMMERWKGNPSGLFKQRESKFPNYSAARSRQERGARMTPQMLAAISQFESLTAQLREQMRKQVHATRALAHSCLHNFIQLQLSWSSMMTHKWSHAMGFNEASLNLDPDSIIRNWQTDFDFQDATALTLSICNGSLLAETPWGDPGAHAQPLSYPAVPPSTPRRVDSDRASAGSAATSRAPSPTPPATEDAADRATTVLFTAASMYEFSVDGSRREAGLPWLTYVEGEVFDVVGERGELWMARNQDDPEGSLGWIWSKHFARLRG